MAFLNFKINKFFLSFFLIYFLSAGCIILANAKSINAAQATSSTQNKPPTSNSVTNTDKTSARAISQLTGLMIASNEKLFDFSTVNTKYSTWIFFQTDCKACHKMMTSYKCFENKINSVYFVGLMSKPAELILDAKKDGYDKLILFAKDEFAEPLELRVTPTVLIFEGRVLKHRQDNYMSCADIKSKI